MATRRRTKDPEAAIRAAGISLIGAQGFDKVSVAGICREAGVANGTFYNFWRTKEAFTEHMIGEGTQELAVALLRETTDPRDAAEQREDVALIVAFARENAGLMRLALSPALGEISDRVVALLVDQRAEALAASCGPRARDLARAETAITQAFLFDALNGARALDDDLVNVLVKLRLSLFQTA